MKQAPQPSSAELERGYELVPIKTNDFQPNQNARLTGRIVDLNECDETMPGKD